MEARGRSLSMLQGATRRSSKVVVAGDDGGGEGSSGEGAKSGDERGPSPTSSMERRAATSGCWGGVL